MPKEIDCVGESVTLSDWEREREREPSKDRLIVPLVLRVKLLSLDIVSVNDTELESVVEEVSEGLMVTLVVSLVDKDRLRESASVMESVTLPLTELDSDSDIVVVSDLVAEMSLLALRVELSSFESDTLGEIEGESLTVGESVGVSVRESLGDNVMEGDTDGDFVAVEGADKEREAEGSVERLFVAESSFEELLVVDTSRDREAVALPLSLLDTEGLRVLLGESVAEGESVTEADIVGDIVTEAEALREGLSDWDLEDVCSSERLFDNDLTSVND